MLKTLFKEKLLGIPSEEAINWAALMIGGARLYELGEELAPPPAGTPKEAPEIDACPV